MERLGERYLGHRTAIKLKGETAGAIAFCKHSFPKLPTEKNPWYFYQGLKELLPFHFSSIKHTPLLLFCGRQDVEWFSYVTAKVT
jgi:hypothetical protein